MKKPFLIVLLFALSTMFVVIYYLLDRELFYYGKSEFKSYNLLPLKIIPDYTAKWEYGFTLRDQYGFTIAAKGNTYPINNRNVLINEVLKYGFNAESLVAVVIDSNKAKYYVKFSQDEKDKSAINATMYVANKLYKLDIHKWININGNDNYIYTRVLIRNWVMFISIIPILILFYKSYRLLRNYKNKIRPRLYQSTPP